METRDCIILVHGTWGQESNWTKAGSPLFRTLDRMPGASHEIRHFEWSGRNCHAARRRAASDLARSLRSEDMDEFRHIHLLGHSHGGNVALAAASLAPRRVSSVITLATPFITATPRDAPLTQDVLRFLLAPLAYFVTIPMVWVALNLFFRADFPAALIGVAVNLLFWIALIMPWWIAEWFARPFSVRINRKWAANAWCRYRKFATAACPMLCVFDEADEARRAIKFSLMISSRAQVMAWRTFVVCCVFQTLAIAIGLIGWLWYPRLIDWQVTQDSFWFLPVLIITIGFWAAAIASVAVMAASGTISPSLSAFSLGWRTAMDVLFVQLRIDNTPAAGRIHICRLDRRGGSGLTRLRHSLICQDRHTLTTIAFWVSAWARGDENLRGYVPERS
ncbi:MAG: hypothetical protein QOH81_3402 [Sphingomonadales bacterium]|jgi:pimeloyl-ACP methyl ester carboxylesterase|nr:hypothetical protein [Sphingomonadales bacterium]